MESSIRRVELLEDASGGAAEEGDGVRLGGFDYLKGGAGSRSPFGDYARMFVAVSEAVFKKEHSCRTLPYGLMYDSAGGRDRVSCFSTLPEALRDWVGSRGACRFAFVPVHFGRPGVWEFAHALVVALDRVSGSADLFDPNGYDFDGSSGDFRWQEGLSRGVFRFLGRIAPWVSGWTLGGIRENTAVLPDGSGMQGPQAYDASGSTRGRGHCVFWCLLYMLARAENPDRSGAAVAHALSDRSRLTRGGLVEGFKVHAWSMVMAHRVLGRRHDLETSVRESDYGTRTLFGLEFPTPAARAGGTGETATPLFHFVRPRLLPLDARSAMRCIRAFARGFVDRRLLESRSWRYWEAFSGGPAETLADLVTLVGVRDSLDRAPGTDSLAAIATMWIDVLSTAARCGQHPSALRSDGPDDIP